MINRAMDYDLLIIGGGLAGSALGRSMALAGFKVLIIEKEMKFRDRVRGEVLLPWGSVERYPARNLCKRSRSRALLLFRQGIGAQRFSGINAKRNVYPLLSPS
jgi:2-polyprenyl-6-methoxyphenol hydroxylase-like FAD-dependent oxidoreductase